MTYEEFCNERDLRIKTASPTTRADWDSKANHFNLSIGDQTHTLLYTQYSMGCGHASAWARKNPRAIIGLSHVERARIGKITHMQRETQKETHAFMEAFERAIVKNPTLIPVAEVIGALAMDASCGDMRFEDFCDEMGYDSDSIKAKGIWEACNATRHDLIAAFGKRGYEILMDCEE